MIKVINQYDNAVSIVQDTNTKKYGYQYKGKYISINDEPTPFIDVASFSDGYSVFETEDGSFGLIYKDGTIIGFDRPFLVSEREHIEYTKFGYIVYCEDDDRFGILKNGKFILVNGEEFEISDYIIDDILIIISHSYDDGEVIKTYGLMNKNHELITVKNEVFFAKDISRYSTELHTTTNTLTFFCTINNKDYILLYDSKIFVKASEYLNDYFFNTLNRVDMKTYIYRKILCIM